jgi:hypothetical protein
MSQWATPKRARIGDEEQKERSETLFTPYVSSWLILRRSDP